VSDKDTMSTRYTVTVPALPGCATWGSTLDEAVASAHEAIEGHVAALRDTGQEVPEEATPVVTVELGTEASTVTACRWYPPRAPGLSLRLSERAVRATRRGDAPRLGDGVLRRPRRATATGVRDPRVGRVIVEREHH